MKAVRCENVRRWPRRATQSMWGDTTTRSCAGSWSRAGPATRPGAQRWWRSCSPTTIDRIRGMVMLQSRGHLSCDEQDEALQRALVNRQQHDRQFPRDLDGRVGRGDPHAREVRVHRHPAPRGRDLQARALARARGPRRRRHGPRGRRRLRRDRGAAPRAGKRRGRSEALAKRQGFLDWAVPQLSPKRRAVIQLDRADVPVEDMQERLSVSRDVVYASRSRAIKDLAKLRDGYGS